mmetsp:Transcript_15934/g.37877  ORF Transcript_15934/g.37877 Transcript_15934/m.37877 type:complete len:272 (+) Transcript_15934:421-1236(+)
MLSLWRTRQHAARQPTAHAPPPRRAPRGNGRKRRRTAGAAGRAGSGAAAAFGAPASESAAACIASSATGATSPPALAPIEAPAPSPATQNWRRTIASSATPTRAKASTIVPSTCTPGGASCPVALARAAGSARAASTIEKSIRPQSAASEVPATMNSLSSARRPPGLASFFCAHSAHRLAEYEATSTIIEAASMSSANELAAMAATICAAVMSVKSTHVSTSVRSFLLHRPLNAAHKRAQPRFLPPLPAPTPTATTCTGMHMPRMSRRART